LTNLTHNYKLRLQLSGLFWKSMDWLYPPRCCNCDRRGFVFCDACLAEVEQLGGRLCNKCGYPVFDKNSLCEECRISIPLYTQMRSWATFSGSIKEAVHALKYKRNLALGRLLALPLLDIVNISGWQIDLVVPIPLSRSRLRFRGYNQAALISHPLADLLGVQHSNNTVKRIKETSTQTEMDVNKRFMNLLDAFYVNPATLKKRNILIIDDVITTGATMQNCAKALQNAGAENIYCLSVARAILRHAKHHSVFSSKSVP
jgi:competence protein ComFC